MFTKAQIEAWAKTPEVQSLSGVLQNAGLSDDIDAKELRAMQIAEKFRVRQ